MTMSENDIIDINLDREVMNLKYYYGLKSLQYDLKSRQHGNSDEDLIDSLCASFEMLWKVANKNNNWWEYEVSDTFIRTKALDDALDKVNLKLNFLSADRGIARDSKDWAEERLFNRMISEIENLKASIKKLKEENIL